MPQSQNTHTVAARQRGLLLQEALVGMLIFSIGLLGIVELQSQTMTHFGNARYRADATLLANHIITTLRTEVSSTVPSPERNAQLQARFNSRTDCDAQAMDDTASLAAEDGYCRWRIRVAATLPMGGTHRVPEPQVELDDTGLLTVTVFWRAPSDNPTDATPVPPPHHYTTVAHIAGPASAPAAISDPAMKQEQPL